MAAASVRCPLDYGPQSARHRCLQLAVSDRRLDAQPRSVRERAVTDPERTLALQIRAAAIQPNADTMPIVALSTEAAPVARILNHIGEPAEPPRITPARGPPA
jgi:hypothetical protein